MKKKKRSVSIPKIKKTYPDITINKDIATLMTKEEAIREDIRLNTLKEGDDFNPYFIHPLGVPRLQLYKLYLLKNKEDAITLFIFYMLEAEKYGPLANRNSIIDYLPEKHIQELNWSMEKYLETYKILIEAKMVKMLDNQRQIKIKGFSFILQAIGL